MKELKKLAPYYSYSVIQSFLKQQSIQPLRINLKCAQALTELLAKNKDFAEYLFHSFGEWTRSNKGVDIVCRMNDALLHQKNGVPQPHLDVLNGWLWRVMAHGTDFEQFYAPEHQETFAHLMISTQTIADDFHEFKLQCLWLKKQFAWSQDGEIRDWDKIGASDFAAIQIKQHVVVNPTVVKDHLHIFEALNDQEKAVDKTPQYYIKNPKQNRNGFAM